jgi:hypothetical protein
MGYGGDIEAQIEKRKQVAAKRIAGSIDSEAILVQIPEPDFSMPFNVNSVTNLVLGFLIVNLFTALVLPQIYQGVFLTDLRQQKIQREKINLENKRWKDAQD